jgi:hypothetical protein
MQVQRPFPGIRFFEEPLDLIILDRTDELIEFLSL